LDSSRFLGKGYHKNTEGGIRGNGVFWKPNNEKDPPINWTRRGKALAPNTEKEIGGKGEEVSSRR